MTSSRCVPSSRSRRLRSGTQEAFYIRDFLANAFRLSAAVVTVQSCRTGRAFGGKTICTVEAEAAALARATGRPVKVQWTRAQEFALVVDVDPLAFRLLREASSFRTLSPR